MSITSFTVSTVGTPDASDTAAYLRVVRAQNDLITQKNAREQARIDAINADRAAQVPPLDPLPFSPEPLLAETLASYESLLAVSVLGEHSSHVQRATDAELKLLRQKYAEADEQTRDAVRTTLQFQTTNERER